MSIEVPWKSSITSWTWTLRFLNVPTCASHRAPHRPTLPSFKSLLPGSQRVSPSSIDVLAAQPKMAPATFKQLAGWNSWVRKLGCNPSHQWNYMQFLGWKLQFKPQLLFFYYYYYTFHITGNSDKISINTHSILISFFINSC